MHRASVAYTLTVPILLLGSVEMIAQPTATSRLNAVRITLPNERSMGSGFFIDPLHVATCYHVVAPSTATEDIGPIAKRIVVTTTEGEAIDATCTTEASADDVRPRLYDFAILRLSRLPATNHVGLKFASAASFPEVGDDIVFSGYPLDVELLTTLRGYVSGRAVNRLYFSVQAPVNKGSSGSAVLNSAGEVIGIISNREGQASKELREMGRKLRALETGASGLKVQWQVGVVDGAGGVSPLSATSQLIDTLHQYISTGIGYARTSRIVADYIAKRPEALR